ncbi:MAG: Gfo/Idh/MocA family oxidoreductase [Verrucomicrobiota bacterium]
MIDYHPQLPQEKRPIYIIGAGGIVKDAHLPAYRKAGFEVAGITNRTRARADGLAEQFGIPNVFDSIEELIAAAPENAIFDLTLMPAQFVPTLELLPDGAAVLIQKPMGDSLPEALEILEVCRRKKLVAAINCQLRFAPFVIAARNLVQSGAIGELYDMEIRVSVQTPWDLFPNVKFHPRLEIAQHSVHHIDLVRSFLGNPQSVMAKTVAHPAKPMSSTRTGMILDYGNKCRAVLSVNHDHDFGADNQESFIKWEGTKGAIKARMGLLMNYPDGAPDKFEYCLVKEGEKPAWIEQKLEGSWFPEAFIGSMSSLMCFVEGLVDEMPTSVENVVNTMAVVEAAYVSNEAGGIVPDYQS